MSEFDYLERAYVRLRRGFVGCLMLAVLSAGVAVFNLWSNNKLRQQAASCQSTLHWYLNQPKTVYVPPQRVPGTNIWQNFMD